MWQVQRQMAALAIARLSDSSDFQVFLATTIPAVAYLSASLAAWLVVLRRAIKERRISLRSSLALITILAPGLVMLRWVYWPY